MKLVYHPLAAVGSTLSLDDNESHHLQVLRAAVGEQLQVLDGIGSLYEAAISTITKRETTITINQLVLHSPPATATLHLAIAPTKNIERLEWLLEKATEIGIQAITPIICRHSERRELRRDRLEKVILSAMKQSKQLYLPTLHPVTTFSDFVKFQGEDRLRCIAYCEEHTTHLKNLLTPHQSLTVMIGPEGDFNIEEITLAKASGYETVSLGISRLRTETAGLLATSIFNLMQV